jgi:X-Pro dipeptidyl-peptidase
MQPKDSVVVAGHRIGVMILSSDQEATIRPAPGTKLTMDLAHSNVTLPVNGGVIR